MAKDLQLNLDRIAEARIPKKFWTLGSDNYYGLDTAKKQAYKYIKRFDIALAKGIGLTFYGPTRGQKTFLICHVLKCLLARDHTALYVTAGEIADSIMDKQSPITFRQLAYPTVLAIDNAEMFSNQFAKEALLRALRARADEGKPFLFATRYEPTEFEEVFGESIAGLLREYNVTVRCEGDPHKQVQELFNVKSQIEV